MLFISDYQSPLGKIILTADEIGLTGLWFEGQKDIPHHLDKTHEKREIPLFRKVKQWLDTYFTGVEPNISIPVHVTGTAFQNEVWEILASIPYGKTITYGEIARQLAEKKGIPRMSAQAIGGAVGRNKISILIPCHRVVGAKGNLIGYTGGIDKKAALLKFEKSEIKRINGYVYANAMHSISTLTSFGRRATSTQLRAGRVSPKSSA